MLKKIPDGRDDTVATMGQQQIEDHFTDTDDSSILIVMTSMQLEKRRNMSAEEIGSFAAIRRDISPT